ncbi:MAG: FHA domain-containing protein, partial [Anaerolineae bacterium]
TDNRGKIQRIPLGGEGITIGRDSGNDLVIDKQIPRWETVSLNHARIYGRGGYWVFEDLDSKNGIYVDGQRTGKNLLEDGRKLGIGGVTLTFHTSSGEVSS